MRSSSAAERRLRRQRVVALRVAGCSFATIAAQTGLSRTGVFNICKRIASAGSTALDDATHPRRRGLLDNDQEAIVRASITTCTPDQLSLQPLLWTPAVVRQWIAQRTGVQLSVRNTALKLKHWGFGPPRPLAKVQLRDGAAAVRWLNDTYPGIVARARAQGAELGWIDVSRLSQPSATEGDASRSAPASGPARSVFSTVDNRGRMRWATFAGPLGAAMFVEMLRRCIHGADRKLVLILDPLRVHRSSWVLQWLAEREDSVEVIHLPGELGAVPSP